MSIPLAVPHRPEPSMPARSIRVPDDLWQDALRAADINHENVSFVTRRDLKAYVERTKREHPDEWEQA
jgi:hypothetical protein